MVYIPNSWRCSCGSRSLDLRLSDGWSHPRSDWIANQLWSSWKVRLTCGWTDPGWLVPTNNMDLRWTTSCFESNSCFSKAQGSHKNGNLKYCGIHFLRGVCFDPCAKSHFRWLTPKTQETYIYVCVCEIFCDTVIPVNVEPIIHTLYLYMNKYTTCWYSHCHLWGLFFWYEQMVQISVIYSDAVVRLLRHIHYYIAYWFKFINVINHVVNP